MTQGEIAPGRIAKLARLARTLRHLRVSQLAAQVRHAILGHPRPTRVSGAAPPFALARPAAPFLPPPDHVHFDGRGRLQLVGHPLSFEGAVPWDFDGHGMLFTYHLHQFEYLRLPDVEPGRRESILLDWIERVEGGPGWDPHPISLRVLCWIKLLQTPGMLDASGVVEERIRSSLADQLDTLAANLELRLQANHLFSNLLTVCAGGLLLGGERAAHWRAHWPRFAAELARQVHTDGGHEERSPMYHGLLLENVLDLYNLACGELADEVAPVATSWRGPLREAALRMLDAHRAWLHGDDEIALFADSALGSAAAPAALRRYAEALGLETATGPPPSRLRDTGYARIESGPQVAIVSVAGPAPPHNPGHAHCDALAFELSLAGTRIVTDTGSYEYLPGERRRIARATASHSTLQFDAEEQAEVWGAHRVGGRPRVEVVGEGAGWIEAVCRPFAPRGLVHRRRIERTEDGLTILDRVDGAFSHVRFPLPLAPGIEVALDLPARRAVLSPRDGGQLLEVELTDGLEWRVEQAPYYPRFGVEEQRLALVGTGTSLGTGRLRFVRV